RLCARKQTSRRTYSRRPVAKANRPAAAAIQRLERYEGLFGSGPPFVSFFMKLRFNLTGSGSRLPVQPPSAITKIDDTSMSTTSRRIRPPLGEGSESIIIDGLTPGTGHQGRHAGVGRVGDKADGGVAEGEIASTGVQAPEMGLVTVVVEFARLE